MMYITHGVGWLALLILDLGAMRRPDCRDKRGGNTPTLFYFHKIHTNHIAEQGVSRP